VKKYLLIILAIVLVATTSCVSRRFEKKGKKYEEAGMYEMAAQAYFRSLQAKPTNIDSRIGLKKNGQRLLDQKILAVHSAYDAGDEKETVYKFLDAKAYQDQVATLGVELLISDRTTEMYKDAKPKYVEKIYNDAQLLLGDEKFKQAEDLLAEVQRLEPGYGNTDEMMKVSKCEPTYRQGKEFMNTGFYRKAYANFDQIIRTHGTYKDSKELRDESLSKGLIAIAINKQEDNETPNPLQVAVESKIRTSLNNLKNPFIKVIDNVNTNQLIKEQEKGLNQGSEIEVGKILAAKALFTGKLLNINNSEGKLSKQEKRGFLKEEFTVKDTAGKSHKEYKYHKVTYFEYSQANKVTASYQYQLVSTETSAVMVSDAMDIAATDELHYIAFDGDGSKLVPGYWESMSKDSPKDRVNGSSSDVEAIRKLIKADRNIKSMETLKNEVIDKIADRVAKKINSYNPEEQ